MLNPMTSENPSTEVPSPEQQFMLNVTRKKPQELSPRQDPNILAPSSISFKDAIMHDMEVLEPTALPIREEGLELTMTEDKPEEHAITLSAQVREKIYASWKSSIIIKVVGKSFGYIAKRLTHIQLLDLGGDRVFDGDSTKQVGHHSSFRPTLNRGHQRLYWDSTGFVSSRGRCG